MTITDTQEFERIAEDVTVTARISGDITLHFGLMRCRNFESDIELTPRERDDAINALCEKALYEAGPLGLSEEEPECKR